MGQKTSLQLQSRATVFAAIAGLLVMMGGFVLYAEFDKPELEKVTIELGEVTILDVNTIDDTAKLQVAFIVGNPSEKTFTVPLISYDLYADGKLLGPGVYTTEDVAMPGRAAFYAGTEIPLKNTFTLTKSNSNADIYDAIINGDDIDFTATGIITAETSWSLIEREF